jgi:hypothetical protein
MRMDVEYRQEKKTRKKAHTKVRRTPTICGLIKKNSKVTRK